MPMLKSSCHKWKKMSKQLFALLFSKLENYRHHHDNDGTFFLSPSGAWVLCKDLERVVDSLIESSKMKCELIKSTKNNRIYKAILSEIDNTPFSNKVFYGELPELTNRTDPLFDQIKWQPEYSHQCSLSHEERLCIKYAFEEMQKPAVTKSKLAEYF